MIYKTIQEFLNEWAYESESTIRVLANLTDESMNQKVTPDRRSLGFLGWHLTETIGEMMGRTGLKIFTPDLTTGHWDEKSADSLRECYKHASESLVEKLKSQWKDETLLIEDEMYGETWKRGFTLGCLVTHQIHHRGQMTVLMRQAGLKVPGIYGPSYEEWITYGMEPHK